jgi:hypothetical protein
MTALANPRIFLEKHVIFLCGSWKTMQTQLQQLPAKQGTKLFQPILE